MEETRVPDDTREEPTGEASGSTTCPVCNAVLPVHEGFVTWCDSCEWNLQPEETGTPKSIRDRLYTSLSRRLSHKLFEEMTQNSSPPSALSWNRVLCLFLAILVYALSIGLTLLGLWYLLRTWPNMLAILVVPFLLGTAWLARPRFGKLPRDRVDRNRIPALYRLVEQVARALGTKPPSVIVIDAAFNASFSRRGIRRKTVLSLGLPLFSILDEDEAIALIGHELAHGVNRDPTRGFLVGLALNTLEDWYWIFGAQYAGLDGLGILEAVFELLLSALARLCYLIYSVLCILLYRDTQRAEYHADYLAASVSGTEAMRSSLEKSQLGTVYAFTLQQIALNPSNRTKNLFDEFKRQVAQVPQRELERIRRVGLLGLSRLDSTHPPTAYRQQFLHAHFVAERKVALSPSEFAEVEREVRAFEKPIQRQAVDQLKVGLYYG